jgi:hypothetical protein
MKPGQTITNPDSNLNIYSTIPEHAGMKNITTDGYSLKSLTEGKGKQYNKYDLTKLSYGILLFNLEL